MEKKDISNIKKMYKLNEQNMKKNNVETIKNELIPNNKIKKMVEISKKEKLIKDLEEKINYEINRKEELEENINKMIQDEKDTLKRIQKLDEKQKKIFVDFQKALNDGNSFFNNMNFKIKNEEENFNENNNNINVIDDGRNFIDSENNNEINEDNNNFE